jgi:hypothetical protein
MFSRWSLSLVVVASLALMVSAQPSSIAPAVPRANGVVSCEMRGRLLMVEDLIRTDGPGPHILPARFHYEIEADGQRFVLDLNRFDAQAHRLDNQLVIVRGSLAGNRVTVTDLRQPLDESLIQYVHVTVEGILHRDEIFTCDPRNTGPIVLWNIRSGASSYTLVFPKAQDELTAMQWVNRSVVIQGKLKGGRIEVSSVTRYPMPEVPEWLSKMCVPPVETQ